MNILSHRVCAPSAQLCHHLYILVHMSLLRCIPLQGWFVHSAVFTDMTLKVRLEVAKQCLVCILFQIYVSLGRGTSQMYWMAKLLEIPKFFSLARRQDILLVRSLLYYSKRWFKTLATYLPILCALLSLFSTTSPFLAFNTLSGFSDLRCIQ